MKTVPEMIEELCGSTRFIHSPYGTFGKAGGWLHRIIYQRGTIAIHTFVAEVFPDDLPRLEKHAALTFGYEPFGGLSFEQLGENGPTFATVVHCHVARHGEVNPVHIATLLSEACSAAKRLALLFRVLGSGLLWDFDEEELDLAGKIESLRKGAGTWFQSCASEGAQDDRLDEQGSPDGYAIAPPRFAEHSSLALHPPLHECPGWRRVQGDDLDTSLWFGPFELPGRSKGTAIGIHALAVREVPDSEELWSLLRASNDDLGMPRAGAFEEPSLKGHYSVFTSVSLLAGAGDWSMLNASGVKGMVERHASSLREEILDRCGGSPERAIEWVPARPWRGQGAELRSELLIRELEDMPPEEGYEEVKELFGPAKQNLSPEALAYALHLMLDHAERTRQEENNEMLWPDEAIIDLLSWLVDSRPPEGGLSGGMLRRARRLLRQGR